MGLAAELLDVTQRPVWPNAFTVVYNDLRKAVYLVPSIKPCDDEDCTSCGTIAALLADADVAAYIKSQECKECILLVQTAMCNNFKG